MADLGERLRGEMAARGLTQAQVAVYAGVAQATISDILRKQHVPRLETLFRLADMLQTPRLEVLCRAGYLRRADAPTDVDAPTSVGALATAAPEVAPLRGRPPAEPDPLAAELLERFRALPRPWQQAALEFLATLQQLAAAEGREGGAWP